MKLVFRLMVVASFLLGGCWDRTEINDLAIVMGAAIDQKDDDRIELTAQIFITKASSSGGGQHPGGSTVTSKMSMIRVSEGVNLSDAMSKIQAKVSRKVFWGHCKVYIFGEEAAKKGISSHIDYLMRNPEPRLQSVIFVSRGLAKDNLGIKGSTLERSTVEVLREYSYLHTESDTTLVDVRNGLREVSHAVTIPLLNHGHAWQNNDPTKEKAAVAGTAIFKQDKLVGTLTIEETQALQWLKRKEQIQKNMTVKPFEEEPGYFTIQPLTKHLKLVPSVHRGQYRMKVDLDLDGVLLENSSSLNPVKPDDVKQMEQKVKDEMIKSMSQTLDTLQKKLKADAVGFGLILNQDYPDEWNKRKDKWPETFSKMDVDYHVNVSIKRAGMVNESTQVQRGS